MRHQSIFVKWVAGEIRLEAPSRGPGWTQHEGVIRGLRVAEAMGAAARDMAEGAPRAGEGSQACLEERSAEGRLETLGPKDTRTEWLGLGGGLPVRETGPERQRGNGRFCPEVEAAEN